MPAPGRKVRNPVTRRHIPEEGIEVSESDIFWCRRLIAGDVVLVELAEPAEKNDGHLVQ
jgi:hypothetical protein